MTNRPLGYFDLNTNQIIIDKDNLLEKNQCPRDDEGQITHGIDLKTFKRINYTDKENFFSKPKNFKEQKGLIYIFGEESVENLIDIVNADLSKFHLKLIFIYQTLNNLFPNKTRLLFEHFRSSEKNLYNEFKKKYLDVLKDVGRVKGDIQFELEGEGLIGSNFILRMYRRIKFKLK